MEVYILDSLYRRIDVVERFESIIWTERFSAYGDFELIVHSTLENRGRFVPGVRLANSESYRVMTVETVEDATDDEGRRVLKVKGLSLEAILEQRLAMYDFADMETDAKWIIQGLPKDIIDGLFNQICVVGLLDPGDIIPGIIEGNVIFPDDTIAAPIEEVVYEIEPMTLYKAMKDLADIFVMGFRMVRHPVTNLLYFDVYMGSDRTTSQTDLASVVFSPDLENLRNTTKLTTNAFYKNVAYVVSPVGYEIVYPLDVDPSVEGFERRVLFVKASDIDDVIPADATARMIQRGVEELAKNRRFTGLDGEIALYDQYEYGVHYNLGDLVELRDDDGSTAKMQVTEQIIVSDREGTRCYPTLTINTFVTPGSWIGWPSAQEWDDLTTEVWEDLP